MWPLTEKVLSDKALETKELHKISLYEQEVK